MLGGWLRFFKGLSLFKTLEYQRNYHFSPLFKFVILPLLLQKFSQRSSQQRNSSWIPVGISTRILHTKASSFTVCTLKLQFLILRPCIQKKSWWISWKVKRRISRTWTTNSIKWCNGKRKNPRVFSPTFSGISTLLGRYWACSYKPYWIHEENAQTHSKR